MGRKTILAVDDDPVVLEAINEVFSRDYNILLAKDGHEAVEIANEHEVDLILLDIMMPGFDGFSTLLLLKNNERTADIPVIMLTAVGKKEKIVVAFRDGAAGYVLKPFKEDTLRSKIEKIIADSEEKKRQKAQSAQGAESPAAPQSPEVPEMRDDTPGDDEQAPQ